MKTLTLFTLLCCQDADLARKCGSEVKWETSMEDALARAAKEKKIVCWYVYTVAGTKMDRKVVVDNYMKTGPFMAPDVIDVLNRRFVPLRMGANRDHAKTYGIRILDFIGRARSAGEEGGQLGQEVPNLDGVEVVVRRGERLRTEQSTVLHAYGRSPDRQRGRGCDECRPRVPRTACSRRDPPWRSRGPPGPRPEQQPPA